MPALWRLTRTDPARRVYEALKARGVTATQMDEYVAETADAGATRELDADVEIRGLDPSAARRHDEWDDAFDELRDDERAMCAFDGDRLVGYLFLGEPASTYHIHPLETDVTFPGGYVRRVFVAPPARNRGIATALVSQAVAAADDDGAETVHALIARDNRPSQWTFEANGFCPERTHSYYRIGPWRRLNVTEV
jgi:GNAT superfamily N-acetyltransferase